MPIFDYQCSACGHQFDALQKLAEAPLKDCPACGEPALNKLLSAPNFQLKGSGWRQPKAEKPVTKTRRGHMFDSPHAHADHGDSGHGHSHDHSADHGHSPDQGHGHSHSGGHSHDH